MNISKIPVKSKRDNKNRKPVFSSRLSLGTFLLLIGLYFATSVLVVVLARSGFSFDVAGKNIPVSAFAGVFTSISSICMIFVAFYFGKVGFITALVILIVQFPISLRGILMSQNLQSLPGIFIHLLTIITIILIRQRNRKIDEFQQNEMDHLKEQQRFSQHLFEQTATALVNAVDAKDTYSHGHSLRVAEYSEKIARALGKSEEECYKIYYAAVLHDVGKIGIDDRIINKKGRLTDEEYAVIKQHPAMGNQILSSIREYPYLSIGAHYHHERYDGKGYPEGLKGDDIPEIARIISVADAYDAMTSTRSYRDAIPQQIVREEIVKGAGTQFDPVFAKIMQQLIDEDLDFEMREKAGESTVAGRNELRCVAFRSEVSDGILVTAHTTRVNLRYIPDETAMDPGMPTIILFDALDGRVHDDEKTMRELHYFEYCTLRFDGSVEKKGARKIKTDIVDRSKERNNIRTEADEIVCCVEATKIRDHVLIEIDDGSRNISVTVALPDSSRYAYIGLSGEHCIIKNVSIKAEDTPSGFDRITRIAEEISYINGPEGDMPNIQIDSHRSGATFGVPVTDGMKISFHTRSLPTSRLIWHCPYIVLFYSEDREVYGNSYREFALIRLDGESSGDPDLADNSITIHRDDDLSDWFAWKDANREGYDCTVNFEKHDNEIIVTTSNGGVSIRNTTTIKDGSKIVYVALSGDQCALTDIRVARV